MEMLIEVQMAEPGSRPGPGGVMELGVPPSAGETSGRPCVRGQQGGGELSCGREKECGDGLSVVKILWRMKRNQVTVFCGLRERFWNVCIGPGSALSSRGPSRGP